MKILQLCFTPIKNSKGGTEKVFCNMANYMCQKHNVMNVCCDGINGRPLYPLNKSVELYDLLDKKINFPIHIKLKTEITRIARKLKLTQRESPKNIYKINRIKNKFTNLVDEFDPDIIICYQASTLYLINEIGFNLSKVIVMFHTKLKVNKLTYNEKLCLKKVGAIQVLLDSAKILLNKLGYTNVVVIGNSVDAPLNSSIDLLNKENIICYVGRMDKKIKRPHLLVEAFSLISEKYPDWKVIFYGGNSRPKGYQDYLEKYLIENNLDKNIIFYGFCDDVLEKLRNASIFVVTSKEEGFCIALLEAMRMGLACIGFKSCSSVNELIVDNVNGYLCEDNIKSLAQRIDDLIIDKNQRILFGEKGMTMAEKYNERVIFEQWNVLLEKVALSNKNNQLIN